jgi:hypothetical protein
LGRVAEIRINKKKRNEENKILSGFPPGPVEATSCQQYFPPFWHQVKGSKLTKYISIKKKKKSKL